MENVDISTLKANPKNPRFINKFDYDKLVRSIKKFGDLSGIVFNETTGQLVGGHQRIEAFKKLGGQPVITERLETANSKGTIATGHVLLDDEKYSYRVVQWGQNFENAANVAANKIQGEFDKDLLAELIYETSQLENGEELLDLMGITDEEINKLLNIVGAGEQPEEKGNLNDTFIVPPFSTLDTRQGYWRSRAAAWGSRIGDVSATREGTLGMQGLSTSGNYAGFDFAASGVSELDPVLCEVAYRWFSPGPGTNVFNPFGGEPVSAFVAAYLGYSYGGTEIRAEQVEETYRKINTLDDEQKALVNLQVGDARHCAQIFAGTTADLIFSSPPFYDLEVYSDKPEDMSNLETYEQFMESYRQAFTGAVSMLNDNRFVCINITEIRDKAGVYRNFVGDNVKLFTDLGLKFYNDIIIINTVGTAAVRAARTMSNRKVVRTHQNFLVFYKGDINNIKQHFPALEIELPPEFDEITNENQNDDTATLPAFG